MKKLPYILYGLLAAALVGLLIFDYMPDKSIDRDTLTRAGLLLAGLVLSILKFRSRTTRSVSNKKALYTKAYADYIENVFPEDKKLQKLFFDAVDDYNQDKPAAGVAKLEKLLGSCVRRSDRYAVTVFLALCLDEMQVYDKAAEQYRAALSIKPHSSLASNLGLVLDEAVLPQSQGPARLETELSKDVFLLKLTPGLNPAVFDMLTGLGYKGIVIEAFGLGGFNVLNEGLRGIRKAVEQGLSIVVTTQCLYDSADLEVYQVGKKLLELGVIQGRDMTSEAAMTKLMWGLGQGMDQQAIAELFRKNLAGEVTV